MVKKLLIALLQLLVLAQSLTLATEAAAQSFPQPPDVPAYVPVTPMYKTDGTANVVIDSTVTPMPIGSGLANIPVPSTTGRVHITGAYDGSAPPFLLTQPWGGTGSENKFRTQADFCFMANDDPVRNFGQPGTSHLHNFYGNCSANANSTYKSLRDHGLRSTAAGTDVNGTAYWVPAVIVQNPYGDGKDYAIKSDGHVIYYNENPASDGTGVQAKAHIPMGLRYVFAFDMDSSSPTTQYAWLQTILDQANAAQGYTRYRLTSPVNGKYPIRMTFVCSGATPTEVDYIVNPDGSDPYNGTCNDGQLFYEKLPAPSCYDGTNLWTPGGYKNVIPGVYDSVAGGFVCPYNYYKIPQLIQEIRYTQHGWSDRQRWVLSSDLAYRAAHGLDASQVPAGMTGHGDWFGGWDDNFLRKAEDNCIGVEHTVGHECDSSQLSPTEYLIGGYIGEAGAGGRSPQVDFASQPHVLETDPGWALVDPTHSGATMNMHVHN